MHHHCPTLVAERLGELVRQLKANAGTTGALTDILAAVAEEVRAIAGHVDRLDTAQRNSVAQMDGLESRIESLEVKKAG
jgi:hypothetical protein